MRLDDDDPMTEILTIAEAAQTVDRSPATLRSWIRDETLVPIRAGRRTFTTARDVREAERVIYERSNG